MKKYTVLLVLPLLIVLAPLSVVNAQSGYYMSEEEYRLEQARQDALQSQADAEEYKLDAKVAAAEEQEAKEKAEADEANKRLLIYVVIGVAIVTAFSFISHSWQKHSMNVRARKR